MTTSGSDWSRFVSSAPRRQRRRELRRVARRRQPGRAQDRTRKKRKPEQAEPESGKGFFAKLFGWITPDEKKEAPQERPRRRRESFGARVGLQGGMTALLLAARQGHVESVKKLLDGGADINQLAEGSKTSPILIATMNGHFDLAKYLLDRGADPTLAAEPSNITPLYAVINLAWAPRAAYPQPTFHKQQELTHLELKEALLQKGADPNVRLTKKVWFMGYNSDRSGVDENGATPFWRAAYGSDVAAMRLLRSYGADVNKPTRKPRGRPRVGNQEGREIKDVSGLPPVPVGGPAITPLHAAAGAGYGGGIRRKRPPEPSRGIPAGGSVSGGGVWRRRQCSGPRGGGAAAQRRRTRRRRDDPVPRLERRRRHTSQPGRPEHRGHGERPGAARPALPRSARSPGPPRRGEPRQMCQLLSLGGLSGAASPARRSPRREKRALRRR